jgi:hypothetical protein
VSTRERAMRAAICFTAKFDVSGATANVEGVVDRE